jgi:protein-disulfide isomerase
MANEKVTVKKETGSKLTPVIIIGAIFLATVFGIYMISRSGGAEDANTNRSSATGGGDNSAPAANPNAPPGATPPHFKGSQSSPVVVEEFADFQCPTCRIVHPKMNEIVSRYGNRIKFVFRNYPLTQTHPNAYAAAVAAEAAGMQNKFWEMQNIIFNNQAAWSNLPNPKPQFESYAQKLGLDIEKFKNDSLAMNTKGRVDADIKRGSALDIRSTPTVLINGRQIPFQQLEVDPMSQLIDAELAKFDQSKSDAQPKPEATSNK